MDSGDMFGMNHNKDWKLEFNFCDKGDNMNNLGERIKLGLPIKPWTDVMRREENEKVWKEVGKISSNKMSFEGMGSPLFEKLRIQNSAFENPDFKKLKPQKLTIWVKKWR